MPPRVHPAAGFDAALVAQVLDDALASGVRIYGVCGLQGSGKSTLAKQVAAMARSRGVRVAVLSIDDIYLRRRDRLRLARQVHPLLATRGPPGTHDVALGCDTLDALRAGMPVALPRFDKLADTRLPPSRWRRVGAVDLVLFEGWFLCTPPQDDDALRDPVNAIERDEDADATWRRYCNDALARDYPALWSRIDRLLFLQPPDFATVPQWRWQQEQAMQARRAGSRGLDRAGVERFVALFERVSRQALRTLPGIADRTLRLDAQRRPVGWGSA
ncbi:kinase [Lysobacter auxotrophicus]|uniref:Kinase n=1 Tax=Lysobacter auxotrophicus TaxID=2992573 RepID=A0ABM8DGJ2_9GAMM|nr:kinase [Lysobacter auxotrophicus]BDU17718.1 kinase [Lysobacter auxotrophicus]